MVLAPVLTPHGTLALKPSNDGVALPRGLGAQLQAAFARGSGHGLLALGADHVGAALPPVLSYWRELGVRYVTALCALPGLGDGRAKSAVPLPADDTLQRMSAGVPPIAGAEYLTAAALADLWHRIDAAFEAEQAEAELPAQDFFKARHPAWNLVGRVHFNLTENRKDEAAPFAFMATYTTGLSVEGKAQHLPLGKALQDYAGARNRQRLLSLLTPVQRAAEACAWLKGMVDAGEIYHPLRWRPSQAMQFLKDVLSSARHAPSRSLVSRWSHCTPAC
jgi:non-specific serine/threonine protein kinase